MILKNDPSGSKDPKGFAPLRLVIILFTLTEAELSLAFFWAIRSDLLAFGWI